MGRKEDAINMAVMTALGLGGAITYNYLRKNGPPNMEKIAEQVATMLDYKSVARLRTGPDYFQRQIPGGERWSSQIAELIAEPDSRWEEVYLHEPVPSLSAPWEIAYMEVRPANQRWLPKLFLRREFGGGIKDTSATDGELRSIVLNFIVGKRHLPFHPKD